jgi:hypothetical protein
MTMPKKSKNAAYDHKVTSVTRSPMNNARWQVTLQCGHWTWVTAKRKPKLRVTKCAVCEMTAARAIQLVAEEAIDKLKGFGEPTRAQFLGALGTYISLALITAKEA